MIKYDKFFIHFLCLIMSKIVILGRNYGKKALLCPDLYILMDLGLYVIIFYVFCKQDEKFNKRTLLDDFLIFIPLKLPTMVILKQQNTVKRVLFSCHGLWIREYLSLLLSILHYFCFV